MIDFNLTEKEKNNIFWECVEKYEKETGDKFTDDECFYFCKFYTGPKILKNQN